MRPVRNTIQIRYAASISIRATMRFQFSIYMHLIYLSRLSGYRINANSHSRTGCVQFPIFNSNEFAPRQTRDTTNYYNQTNRRKLKLLFYQLCNLSTAIPGIVPWIRFKIPNLSDFLYQQFKISNLVTDQNAVLGIPSTADFMLGLVIIDTINHQGNRPKHCLTEERCCRGIVEATTCSWDSHGMLVCQVGPCGQKKEVQHMAMVQQHVQKRYPLFDSSAVGIRRDPCL